MQGQLQEINDRDSKHDKVCYSEIFIFQKVKKKNLKEKQNKFIKRLINTIKKLVINAMNQCSN